MDPNLEPEQDFGFGVGKKPPEKKDVSKMRKLFAITENNQNSSNDPESELERYHVALRLILVSNEKIVAQLQASYGIL